jgi:hypothetical protein
MRGGLHCATDDKTVRRFGRDDGGMGWAIMEGGPVCRRLLEMDVTAMRWSAVRGMRQG